jgi:hypothetical protein
MSKHPVRALVLSAVALGLITGCQPLIKDRPSGHWVALAPGGSLTLHQPVTMPAGRTRVFFVNGRVRTSGATYDTSCALEVRRIDRERSRQIAAGLFRVTRVQPYWTQMAAVPNPETPVVRLAGHDGGDGGDGNAMIRSGYQFDLRGNDPDVRRLTCLGALADPAYADPPTLADIDAALGTVATLTNRSDADG